MFRFWQVWSTVGLYGVVPCWKDGRRVREHSEQFGRNAVALVESASFPNGQVVADLGISRSSLQVWPREGPACLARPVALACSHAIAPPWAPPRPDAPPGREKSTCARQRPMERQNSRPQHRPAGGFRLVSQRAVDSPPGWGHRLAQSFTCDRGSQSRTAAFTAMITTHEPGLFHGSRRRRRPGRSHGNLSFRPRLELIRAFLLTGLDPIDLHNIPPKSHKHRTLQGARVSLSSFRVKAACVSHRQRREPPGTADELVWRQLPSCD